VIARIPLIREFDAAAFPFQSHSVFGHIVYIECARARRNSRAQSIEPVAARSIKLRHYPVRRTLGAD
jgi:hypothetical protein